MNYSGVLISPVLSCTIKSLFDEVFEASPFLVLPHKFSAMASDPRYARGLTLRLQGKLELLERGNEDFWSGVAAMDNVPMTNIRKLRS